MEAEFKKLISDNLEKVLDALQTRSNYEASTDVEEYSPFSKPLSDEIEYDDIADEFDRLIEQEEQEEEEEEENEEGDEEKKETSSDSDDDQSDQQWDFKTTIKRRSNDLNENISNLREKVESLESKAECLTRIIEYLTIDPDIIKKLDEIDPFPIQSEKGSLRLMVNRLDRRVSTIENQDDDEEEISAPILVRGKSKLKSLPILDMLVEPKAIDAQLQYVYGNKTNGEIISILKADIIRMTNQLTNWQETNLEVSRSLEKLKCLIPSGSLRSCVYEINLMKIAIDIMTGGQFKKGGEIVFLNPNRVGNLEKQIKDTGVRLKTLEEVMQQLSDFDHHIRKRRKKFNPYLRSIIFDEPLPGESEQRDIGVDKLQERIQVVKSSMQNITVMSAQLLKSQEERDNRLAKIGEKIKRLRYVKVDKEDVEDILTEKSDQTECNLRINREEFVDRLRQLAEFNDSCTLSLDDKESLWRSTVDDVLTTCETKANKSYLEKAKEELENNVKCMIEKLRYIREMATEKTGLSKKLGGLVCVSCGRTISDMSQSSKEKFPSTIWPEKKLEHKNQPHRDTIPRRDVKRVSKRYCGGSHTLKKALKKTRD